jgi:hypothetical protein
MSPGDFGNLVSRYRASEDPMKTERRVELALVAMVCILLLQIVFGLSGMGRVVEIVPIAPAADALAPEQGLSPVIPSLEQSTEMEKRPLFWASRRPVDDQVSSKTVVEEAARKDKPTSAKPLKGVQLLAVFAQGDEGVVILLAEGKRHRLSVGEEIQGWAVHSIDADGVEVRRGASVKRLELVHRDIPGPSVAEGVGSAAATAPRSKAEIDAAAKQRAIREKADNTLSFGGG